MFERKTDAALGLVAGTLAAASILLLTVIIFTWSPADRPRPCITIAHKIAVSGQCP